jgi:hypothetical protein
MLMMGLFGRGVKPAGPRAEVFDPDRFPSRRASEAEY